MGPARGWRLIAMVGAVIVREWKAKTGHRLCSGWPPLCSVFFTFLHAFRWVLSLICFRYKLGSYCSIFLCIFAFFSLFLLWSSYSKMSIIFCCNYFSSEFLLFFWRKRTKTNLKFINSIRFVYGMHWNLLKERQKRLVYGMHWNAALGWLICALKLSLFGITFWFWP